MEQKMSLKGKFKTDATMTKDGVWFDLADNSDGSKCRIKLRRHGRSNRDWVNAFRKHTADKDMETITAEEDEAITANTFAEACVVDWEHFQPEDDGVELPFSVENAVGIFLDPDWNDLLKECQTLAGTRSNFQKKLEGEAKN
jgi:hypothetical protein